MYSNEAAETSIFNYGQGNGQEEILNNIHLYSNSNQEAILNAYPNQVTNTSFSSEFNSFPCTTTEPLLFTEQESPNQSFTTTTITAPPIWTESNESSCLPAQQASYPLPSEYIGAPNTAATSIPFPVEIISESSPVSDIQLYIVQPYIKAIHEMNAYLSQTIPSNCGSQFSLAKIRLTNLLTAFCQALREAYYFQRDKIIDHACKSGHAPGWQPAAVLPQPKPIKLAEHLSALDDRISKINRKHAKKVNTNFCFLESLQKAIEEMKASFGRAVKIARNNYGGDHSWDDWDAQAVALTAYTDYCAAWSVTYEQAPYYAIE